jgi:hypothetical protein
MVFDYREESCNEMEVTYDDERRDSTSNLSVLQYVSKLEAQVFSKMRSPLVVVNQVTCLI